MFDLPEHPDSLQQIGDDVNTFLKNNWVNAMERFGEKLRALREHKGLSYRQLAAQLQITHSHLAGMEAGTGMPSIELAEKIVRYFKVSFDELLDDKRELKI